MNTNPAQSALLERIEALRTEEGVHGVAKALYDQFVEQQFDEYAPWSLLPGKGEWLDRARAVIAHILGEG